CWRRWRRRTRTATARPRPRRAPVSRATAPGRTAREPPSKSRPPQRRGEASERADHQHPRLPVGDAFEAAINGMRQSLGGLFDFIGLVIRTCVDALYGLFAETSATQFTLLAAAVIAGGLIVRGKYRPTLIAGGVWLVLYVAELVGGVAAAI